MHQEGTGVFFNSGSTVSVDDSTVSDYGIGLSADGELT